MTASRRSCGPQPEVLPVNLKSNATPPVILLIESDTLKRMVASDILVDAGYRVIAEASADHAMVILKVRPDIQAVVTDVSVPGHFDGGKLADLAEESRPGIGLVLTSANRCQGRCDLPKNAQGLTKPYSASELLGAVEAALVPRSKPTLLASG